MVIVNHEGDIVLVNRRALELFGWNREELLGRKIEMLVPARYRPHHPSQRDQFFGQPRRGLWAGTGVVHLHRDGREFPVEISLSPIETEDGVLVSSAIRDITERRGRRAGPAHGQRTPDPWCRRQAASACSTSIS